jgi:hypothetical protein
MRKSQNRIGRLPVAVRVGVNHRLRDGWKLSTIAEWLFAQKAAQDVPDLDLHPGDPYALAWTRTARSRLMALDTCKNSLSKWFRSYYREWLKQEANRNEFIQLVERVEQLTGEASEKGEPGAVTGASLIIRSLLIEALTKVCQGEGDPADIARLSNAWARVNEAGMRVQGSLHIGLQAVRDEIKGNPEALELFNKLYDAVKCPAEGPA